MKKRILVWFFIVIISISMIGCGSSTKSSQSMGTAADMADYAGDKVSVAFNESINDGSKQESVEVTTSPIESGEVKGTSTQKETLVNSANVSQKIIFTGQVSYQTLDFEKTRTELTEYINSIGGYQQNSSIQGGGIGFQGLKSAEYLFRIPKTKYNQAFVDLRKFGTVVFEQSSGEDVTDKYFDTEARLKSLKIQQERLQSLLQKAVKMEDILKIEKELQTTYYEIENFTGTLKKWDSLVEYSTLKVSIKEVEEIKPVTPKKENGFFSRITFGFKNSVIGLWEFVQDLTVFIASALPVIIPLGLIGYLIYRIIRKRIKNQTRKSE